MSAQYRINPIGPSLWAVQLFPPRTWRFHV